VAKGFSQFEGIDYDNIFSPVVRYELVRLIVALAALQHWHIVKLPRGLSVRLERFQVMAIVWEWRKMLPAELR
jgi:hypothetical protein